MIRTRSSTFSAETQKSCDVFGASIAVFCALHCALAPIVLIAFPILASNFLADEAFHTILLIAILPSSGLAFYLGCRRHKDMPVLLLGLIGIFFIVFSALWGHQVIGEIGERITTFMGGLIMAFGHLRNFRLCRQYHCPS